MTDSTNETPRTSAYWTGVMPSEPGFYWAKDYRGFRIDEKWCWAIVQVFGEAPYLKAMIYSEGDVSPLGLSPGRVAIGPRLAEPVEEVFPKHFLQAVL